MAIRVELCIAGVPTLMRKQFKNPFELDPPPPSFEAPQETHYFANPNLQSGKDVTSFDLVKGVEYQLENNNKGSLWERVQKTSIENIKDKQLKGASASYRHKTRIPLVEWRLKHFTVRQKPISHVIEDMRRKLKRSLTD